MIRWKRRVRGARGWGLSAVVLIFVLLAAGRSALATSSAQPPAATPVPILDPTQVKADRTVRTFFAYYDRRDIAGILGLLARHFTYIDCDYRRHDSVLFGSRPAVRHWLLARFSDHDYFGPLGPLTADLGPGKVGVSGPVTRFSDSLVLLASKGLLPISGGDAPFKDVVLPNGRLQLVGMTGYCSSGLRMPGSNSKKATTLARAFLVAYNHHNVPGVIRLLSPSVVYGDCGMGARGQTTSIPQVRACLRSLFAEGDTFAKPKIILNGYLVQSGPPYTIMIQVLRTNSQLLAEGEAPQVTTLGLDTNVSVTRIRQVEVMAPPTQ